MWNAENRLSEVRDNNGDLVESYWYDIDGARVKKVSGSTTTYTFFGHYEEEVSGGSTTAISHYSFGSLHIAVKRGGTLYHSTFWPERDPLTIFLTTTTCRPETNNKRQSKCSVFCLNSTLNC